MLKKLKNNDRAFTLIEVVIVIAIGALIILVVLQAVSNAQQSQRDNTRRQEASQVASALESYAANNAGTYPPSASGSADSVQQAVLNTSYVSEAIQNKNWTAQAGNSSSDCTGTGSTDYQLYYEAAPNNRDYSLFVCLEQAPDPVEIRDN